MTDAERARDYVAAWSSDLDIGALDPVAADAIDALVLLLAAVRLDERTRIGAWLRTQGGRGVGPFIAIRHLAARIERGEHEEGS